MKKRRNFFLRILFFCNIKAGQEFLKRSWGEDGLKAVNALLDARDKSDSTSSDEASPSSSKTKKAAKGKPKLSKTRTMQNTTKVCQDNRNKLFFY